jgi:hypothetical protein
MFVLFSSLTQSRFGNRRSAADINLPGDGGGNQDGAAPERRLPSRLWAHAL